MGDEQRNKEIVRKVEQLWIDGKLDQLDQYFATGDHSHDRPPMVPQGLAGAKMAHQGAMQAFQGRKLGGVPGIDAPAGGRPVKDIESWSVYRLKDGRIVEHWGINDGFAIAMQVGALKMPAMPVGAGA